MNYACLKTQEFTLNQYQLIPIRYKDIFLIKQWRNAQIDILRQEEPLTDEMQKKYFENILEPSSSLRHPKQILFSLLKENQCIGYGGIVHIDWEVQKGEISFLVDTDRTRQPEVYEADFTTFLKLIKEVAFHDLHFRSLYAETYDIRPHHISILESNGFIEEKRVKNLVNIGSEPKDSLIHGYYFYGPMER